MVLLASVLAVVFAAPGIGGEVPFDRRHCPASEMWIDLADAVPGTRGYGRLRRKIGAGLTMARHAEHIWNDARAASMCLESVADYREAAAQFYAGTRQAATERERVDIQTDHLRAALHASRGVAPPPTPTEQWIARDRRLVTHIAVSSVFVGIAVLMATIPWAVLSAQHCSKCEGIGPFYASIMAIPVALGGGIGLAVWGSRLARHGRTPPPGITWPGRAPRLALSPTGLRLRF